MRKTGLIVGAAGVVVFSLFAATASAAFVIPPGWTCNGTCGTLGADGVVTAPPVGTEYQFISTAPGANGVPAPTGVGQLPGVGGTNGSLLTTNAFSASGSDQLVFDFNYVTSDGSEFADYAWAELVPSGGGSPIVLFDARTTPSGNTVPGFGLPPIAVTLTPPSTPIIAGATTWSPLGSSSGACFNGVGQGCGNTNWIQASFTPAAGTYTLQFGVTNFLDTAFDSGLAIAGASIGGVPITPTDAAPEPTTLILVGAGLIGALKKARSRV